DLRTDAGMDAFVGHHLDLMISQGGEDQDAGARLGDVQAVGQELLHGGAANARAAQGGWRQQSSHGGDQRQEENGQEHSGLNQSIRRQRAADLYRGGRRMGDLPAPAE